MGSSKSLLDESYNKLFVGSYKDALEIIQQEEIHIAANLRAQGFEVADEIVQLPEHIKEVGTHAVTLKFADNVTATVNVVVVPEQQEDAPETDAG